jgi:cytidylate kinase
MYRAVALYCIRRQAFTISEVESVLLDLRISIQYIEKNQRVILNDEDVTDLLRTPEVTEVSSKVAAIPAVREKLLSIQRNIAQTDNIIMDGRDIGTKVLPNAQIKIYLDADIHTRTIRRMGEQQGSDYESVKDGLMARDHRDMTRQDAPLTCASDAHYLDTTDMEFEEVKQKVLELVSAKLS